VVDTSDKAFDNLRKAKRFAEQKDLPKESTLRPTLRIESPARPTNLFSDPEAAEKMN
jgi:hypothetical protein